MRCLLETAMVEGKGLLVPPDGVEVGLSAAGAAQADNKTRTKTIFKLIVKRLMGHPS
jgi:hypothetical protein